MRRHFEMTLTRADFLRWLPVAVGHAPYRIDSDEIAADGGPVTWRIHIEERPGRAFGSIALPVLGITLDVDETSEGEAGKFVERFLLGFQRAGG